MKLDVEQVAQGFAAMGSEARLQVLLTLVKAGGSGLTVGDIQEQTGMAASTLAHHLRFLSSAGLINQQKQGRNVLNCADFNYLGALAGYILQECCLNDRGECC